MTKPNYTHIHVLFDRSGSMVGHETDIDGWYKIFFKGQKEIPGECTVSLAQFDSYSYDTVVEWSKVRDLPETFKLEPRGGTPLIDSLARSINELGSKLAALPEDQRPEKVLVVVQTDGEENQSTKFSKEKLKEMVRLQREVYNWEFMFLGADIEAFGDAQSIGISRGSTISFAKSAQGYATSANISSASVNRWRTGATKSAVYTMDEQLQAEATKTATTPVSPVVIPVPPVVPGTSDQNKS